MKLLLVVLLALVVAVIAGHYVAADPGFIVIGYGGKVVRTTFAFFLLVLAAIFIGLMALIGLARNLRQLRGRLQQWSEDRRQRRAQDALNSGLVAMAGGSYADAERLFTRGLNSADEPQVYYLAAAEAAQAQGAAGRRDNYLRLAHDARPEIRNELDIRRAGWLLDEGRDDDARQLVERLAGATVGHPQVLKLRYELLRRDQDHEALLALVPDLRRDHVLSHDAANQLERDSAAALLTACADDAEALDARWRGLGRHLRATPAVITAYVRALCRQGRHDDAETLVRKQVERQWHSALAALYGEIECEPPARQLRKLEAWSMTRGDDPGLRLARARQAIRAGHWGQAREQIEALMADKPSPLLHQLLAEIAEGSNDPATAIAERRAGLALATGEPSHVRLAAPAADAS